MVRFLQIICDESIHFVAFRNETKRKKHDVCNRVFRPDKLYFFIAKQYRRSNLCGVVRKRFFVRARLSSEQGLLFNAKRHFGAIVLGVVQTRSLVRDETSLSCCCYLQRCGCEPMQWGRWLALAPFLFPKSLMDNLEILVQAKKHFHLEIPGAKRTI